MPQILVITALALIWPSMLLAQWRENGKPVPDTSWRKSEGDFGVMLIFTDKPDEFFAVWETRAPGVSVSSTELVKRGSPIMGVVVFTGCSPTEQGLCDATVTYTVFKPDGTVYGGPQCAAAICSPTPLTARPERGGYRQVEVRLKKRGLRARTARAIWF